MAETLGYGTQQFEVITSVDDREVSRRKVHDPFHTTIVTLRVTRWQAFKALVLGHTKVRVIVQLQGSIGAQSIIMRLDPDEMERRTEQILLDSQFRRDEQMRGQALHDAAAGREYM